MTLDYGQIMLLDYLVKILCSDSRMQMGATALAGKKGVDDRMVASQLSVEQTLEQARLALDTSYQPSEDEDYMNANQLAFFRQLLCEWKNSIQSESNQTLQSLQDGPIREPDLNDRASSEAGWSIELRTRDRQRKLVTKINSALRRIDQGEYGYCEETGDPIGLKRLFARPVATMTVEAQESHERKERISRDD